MIRKTVTTLREARTTCAAYLSTGGLAKPLTGTLPAGTEIDAIWVLDALRFTDGYADPTVNVAFEAFEPVTGSPIGLPAATAAPKASEVVLPATAIPEGMTLDALIREIAIPALIAQHMLAPGKPLEGGTPATLPTA